MRLLVVSDTHGDGTNLARVLAVLGGAIDAVLHLGDGCDDVDRTLGRNPLPVYRVRGNADGDHALPLSLALDLGGAAAWCAHGHRYRAGEASGDLAMAREARAIGAKLVFHGHTHVPRLARRNGMLFCCPGSLSRPRGGDYPTFGIVRFHERDSVPHVVLYGLFGKELRAIAY